MIHRLSLPSLLAALAISGCQTLGFGSSDATLEGPVATNAARCAGFYSVTGQQLRSDELYEVARYRAPGDGVAPQLLVPAFNEGSETAVAGAGEAYDVLAAGCGALYDQRYEIVNAAAT